MERLFSEKVFFLEIWSTGNVTSEKTIEVKGEEQKFNGPFKQIQFKFDKNYNYIYTKIADSQKEFDKKYNGTLWNFLYQDYQQATQIQLSE